MAERPVASDAVTQISGAFLDVLAHYHLYDDAVEGFLREGSVGSAFEMERRSEEVLAQMGMISSQQVEDGHNISVFRDKRNRRRLTPREAGSVRLADVQDHAFEYLLASGNCEPEDWFGLTDRYCRAIDQADTLRSQVPGLVVQFTRIMSVDEICGAKRE